jgi:predicted TPR repeat methyltransferase
MSQPEEQVNALIAAYAEEVEATGWFGPEVIFGLSYNFVKPGQTILDVGIGTGLSSDLFRKAGLRVYGIDISPQMLDACRSKGFTDLELHDLTKTPYPFEAESMDHTVCIGVLNFFGDLSLVYKETNRILRPGGLFAFVVGDRAEDEPGEIAVGPEHTNTDQTITMCLHSPQQIDHWLKQNRFNLARSLPFTVYLDPKKTMAIKAKAYVAKKG